MPTHPLWLRLLDRDIRANSGRSCFRPERAASPTPAAWLLLRGSSHRDGDHDAAARNCFRTRGATPSIGTTWLRLAQRIDTVVATKPLAGYAGEPAASKRPDCRYPRIGGVEPVAGVAAEFGEMRYDAPLPPGARFATRSGSAAQAHSRSVGALLTARVRRLPTARGAGREATVAITSPTPIPDRRDTVMWSPYCGAPVAAGESGAGLLLGRARRRGHASIGAAQSVA
jgi:hypothetical protein